MERIYFHLGQKKVSLYTMNFNIVTDNSNIERIKERNTTSTRNFKLGG